MAKRTKRGLVRKYYVFLVNLKLEIESNADMSIFLLLKQYRVDTRLQKAIYDLKLVSRGRVKSWLVSDPTLDMAKACITQISINRKLEIEKRKEKPNLFNNEERYYNTTHKEFTKANPKAVRVGKGYFHPNQEQKFWSEIFSFKIFGIKCKFFKLK